MQNAGVGVCVGGKQVGSLGSQTWVGLLAGLAGWGGCWLSGLFWAAGGVWKGACMAGAAQACCSCPARCPARCMNSWRAGLAGWLAGQGRAHVGVANHARVAVVPVVQAAHIGLHHADAVLGRRGALHKAAGQGVGVGVWL